MGGMENLSKNQERGSTITMSKVKYIKKDFCDMEMKHVAYKKSDILRIKDPTVLEALAVFEDAYEQSRAEQGKNPCPVYLVINTDEPYINEIIDVLRRNNNWGYK
jgi:hypothetical protein